MQAQNDKVRRDVRLLLVSESARGLSLGFKIVILPIYWSLLGFNPVTIGLTLGLMQISGVIRTLVFGVLADRYGRKPFLVVEPLFLAIQFAMFATAKDFTLIATAAVIGGTDLGGAGSPVATAYIADRSTHQRRMAIFSIFWFATSVASAIGSAMSGIPRFFETQLGFAEVDSYFPLFVIGVVAFGLSTVTRFFLGESRTAERQGRLALWPKKSSPIVVKMSITDVVTGLAVQIAVPFIPLLFYTQYKVGVEAVGFTFATGRVTVAIAYLFVPRIVSRLGSVRSIVIPRLVNSFFFAAIPLMPTFPLAVLCWLLSYTVEVGTFPIRRSYLMGIVDPEERGSSASITQMSFMTAGAVAPTIGGFLMVAVSAAAPFFASFFFFLASAGLMHGFFRKIQTPEEAVRN